MKAQLHYLLEKLIIKNEIRVNQEELKLQLLSHPSYPSLHALTGVLRHFRIENVALRVPTDEATLEQLPPFFIADVHFNDEDQLALIEREKNRIKITFDEKSQEIIDRGTFLSKWGGVVLAIEKNEAITESLVVPRSPLFQWLFILLLGFSLSYFIIPQLTLFAAAHFLLSVLGLALSILIVQHDLGMPSGLVHDFCQLSERTSCDATLQSKGANLLGQIKLSDLSLVVFATYAVNWLLVFVSGVSNAQLIAIFSLLAIPFVVYSLYYQYRVVKKWCPLCLGVALVLSLQFGLVVSTGMPLFSALTTLAEALFLLISLLLVMGLWYPLKKLLEYNIQAEGTTIKYLQLKRNFSVFQTLHEQGASWIRPLIPTTKELILGHQNAPIEIVLITNPLCYYCKQTHEEVERLLAHCPSQIKVIIRFNVNIKNTQSLDYQVAARLLQIQTTSGEQDSRAALNAVYDEATDLKDWFAQQQAGEIEPAIEQQLQDHKEWCQDNGINFTPAFYVHQKAFPQAYDKTDLLYFVDELIELIAEEQLHAVDNFLPPLIRKQSS